MELEDEEDEEDEASVIGVSSEVTTWGTFTGVELGNLQAGGIMAAVTCTDCVLGWGSKDLEGGGWGERGIAPCGDWDCWRSSSKLSVWTWGSF